ncbi:hypothetical protein CLV62_13633 [Dysgonomonas alginatilytica]|uniref:Uncharacterized protein n=1 Tax=Dysgonomonas alginatilytica TaxID=1605892 RepID=A0A2V3PKE8_9BACT|nr:hypothetical protein CLV62_13633 [Dysgonomonas alginatilytica]
MKELNFTSTMGKNWIGIMNSTGMIIVQDSWIMPLGGLQPWIPIVKIIIAGRHMYMWGIIR